MPGGDGTGPWGFGPMTGRAAGFCTGFGVPGFANYGVGRGFRVWGRGRGFRHWFYRTGLTGWQRAAVIAPAWGYRGFFVPPPAQAPFEQELDALKAQAEYLEDALEGVRSRITDLSEKADKASPRAN